MKEEHHRSPQFTNYGRVRCPRYKFYHSPSRYSQHHQHHYHDSEHTFEKIYQVLVPGIHKTNQNLEELILTQEEIQSLSHPLSPQFMLGLGQAPPNEYTSSQNEPPFYVLDVSRLLSQPQTQQNFPEISSSQSSSLSFQTLNDEGEIEESQQPPSTTTTTVKASSPVKQDLDPFWSNVCRVILNRFMNITHLNLDSNGIHSLQVWQPLVRLRHLISLSLRHNNLEYIQELQHLKGLGIVSLNVAGNPFLTAQNNQFMREDIALLIQYFPSLESVDDFIIPEEFKGETIVMRKSVLPGILTSSFYENTFQREYIEWFLLQYFTYFDSNRDQLFQFYHENATFSFSYNMNEIVDLPETVESRFVMKPYKPYSRNVRFILEKEYIDKNILESSTISYGKEQIVARLRMLPPCSHNLNVKLVDVQNVPFLNGLLVVFHCPCEQFDMKGFAFPRSIDSVFFMTENQPMDISASLNLPFLIRNHQYHIRPYSSLNLNQFRSDANIYEAWNFGTPASTTTPNFTFSAEAILSDFLQATKLKREFAIPCLEYVGWNLQKAMDVFMIENRNGTIPAQCFQV
ncbi:hypothetical protein C9374_001335 [Naegleria lovaniensis]|uniref:Uncharacterized protein n=1 Tax=Naegleria lovaniensis TaxID=51637 RepID=A0AA88GXH7_NAELO|nr:uncharacterized protein C9374_001335 [Naegleria lovaniensis]KAG2387741.1 hypothetical protein C9374_001335 [Naegleria lovaniensis]